jgi:hypothetical protein
VEVDCFVCRDLLNIFLVNCRPPLTPANGNLDNYTSLRVGEYVTYRCVDGYRPSASMVSVCANTSTWKPPPEDHICTLVVGM